MEPINGHNSYMSIICQDVERSFKWIYVSAFSIPFLVVAIIYIKSAFVKCGEISPPSLRMAVIFFLIAGLFIALGIRIRGFQYHLLIDKVNNHFNYKKDNLFNTVQVKGDINQIKEVYIKQSSFISDSIVKMKSSLYKIVMRYSFQELIVYVSLYQDQAQSMAEALSNFIGVPLGRDGE